MKNAVAYITILLVTISSCTKVLTNTGDPGSGTTPAGKTYLSITQIDSSAKLNVIVTPSNGSLFITSGTVSGAAYNVFASGKTNIKIQSRNSARLFYDSTYTLNDGSISSAFIYPVSTVYKASVVTDDYTTPANGTANIRLLDFSATTSGQTVNFNVSNGAANYSFNNRFFIDHETDKTLVKFINVPAAGNYTLYATLGPSVLINPYSFDLLSGKIYSIVITGITITDLYSFVMPHN